MGRGGEMGVFWGWRGGRRVLCWVGRPFSGSKEGESEM